MVDVHRNRQEILKQRLMDLLGERLVHERLAVRLYDSILSRHRSEPGRAELPPYEDLLRQRDGKLTQFLFLSDTITRLGGDPAVATSSGDFISTASSSLIQAMNDPGATFLQCLTAILIAELTDHDGWETLISLAHETGAEDLADDFRVALVTEITHLEAIRDWIYAMTVGKSIQEVPEHPGRPGLRTSADLDSHPRDVTGG